MDGGKSSGRVLESAISFKADLSEVYRERTSQRDSRELSISTIHFAFYDTRRNSRKEE